MNNPGQANADSMTAFAPLISERTDAAGVRGTCDLISLPDTFADGAVYLGRLDAPMAHAQRYLGWTPYSTPTLRLSGAH
jgi:hypothetical protein